jgi:hypothetical protein
MTANRQQLLGILAIAAVVLLAADRLVWTPLTRLWKERAAALSQTKSSVVQGAETVARDRIIRERWQRFRTNTLPAEPSVAENQMLQSFYRWSKDSQITVNGIKPQWKQSSDEFATLECRVDASGTLGQISRFLYEMEKDPLGGKLDIVELAARDDNGQQLTLTLQVSGLQLNPQTTR